MLRTGLVTFVLHAITKSMTQRAVCDDNTSGRNRAQAVAGYAGQNGQSSTWRSGVVRWGASLAVVVCCLCSTGCYFGLGGTDEPPAAPAAKATASSTAPFITAISPVSAVAGDTVTITGKNLMGTSSSQVSTPPLVLFNLQLARMVRSSQTSLVVTVPEGIVSGDVLASVEGVKSNAVKFKNLAPEITSVPSNAAEVGQTYAYKVSALDARGQTLISRIVQGPPGLVLDAIKQEVTWLPQPGQGGIQSVHLQVSNGDRTSSQQWRLFVRETQLEASGQSSLTSSVTLRVDRLDSPLAGASVQIPAAATTAPVEITLSSSVGEGQFEGLPVAKLEPSGTHFQQPVRVSLPISQSSMQSLGATSAADVHLVAIDSATAEILYCH